MAEADAPAFYVEPTFGQRFLAALVDGALFAVIGFVLTSGTDQRSHRLAGAALAGLYTVAGTTLFGRTIGKLLFRIQVVDAATGALPNPGQALLRWVVLDLGTLLALALTPAGRIAPVVSLAVLLPILTDRLHRGLHDRAAATIVTVA